MDLVSVVVPVSPAHNRPDFLGACLGSLSLQTYPREHIELIITGDGCDVSDTVNRFLDPGIQRVVIHLEHRAGPIRARNHALKKAKGRWVAFLDADAAADRDWLCHLVEGFSGEDIGGGGGDIVDERNRYDNRSAILGSGTLLPFVGFGNAMFRKDVLDEVGFLDEQLDASGHGSEDVDLSWRVCLKGYRLQYAPEAKVHHRGTSHARHGFAYGVGMRRLLEKYRLVTRFSSWVQLGRYGENIKQSFSKKRLLQELPQHLTVVAGYLLGTLKLKSHFLCEPIQPMSLQGIRNLLWWKSERGCTLVRLAENKVYELENVSGRIWELMVRGKSQVEICQTLCEEYSVGSHEAEKDLEMFLEHLRKERILEP